MGLPLLSETRIVLVSPSLPENVGAVARAMRYFGLHDLVIAEGGVDPLHPHAVAASAGAEAILGDARRVAILAEALEGTVLAIGTTARAYDRADLHVIDARSAAQLARDHALFGPVALVFGTEKHGLAKDQLRACHQVARIPGPGRGMSPSHQETGACLNLAMAVNVFGYEWYLAAEEHAHPERAPVLGEKGAASLSRQLDRLLVSLGIAGERDATSKAHTLRRILSRIGLDADEAALVQAILGRLTSGRLRG